MRERFEIEFLEQARAFLKTLDAKTSTRIFYNIDKAQLSNDPEVFKKLGADIWEFRTEYMRLQYRLLAFWDKRNNKKTLVVCTHGFIKKRDKVPGKEIDRAHTIMFNYFTNEKEGENI